MRKTKFLSIFATAALLVGCSTKSSDELFNLPAQAWQEMIIKDLKSADYTLADTHYMSLASEHVGSKLLEDTTLIMAQAYIRDENYAKANEYLDRYIMKYGNSQKIEYAKFLKIKANYESFNKPNRNQALMQDSLIEISQFLQEHPQSIYRPMIETMRIKFKLALYNLDKNIKELYERTGKDVSAKIYKDKLMISGLDDANMVAPQLPWYRAFFE